ncbi:MAG: Unknown protein [uncultured Sulfurovum sp.]|uniref:DUF2062 domain-containing protein n=1 Tax=uncultured Sulfurovum sp. TaxID=269237 RepID=A0A6S6TZD9_9BACT|nr:MAG: Unknown protein [uncultured Sulfurovum sp.]
MIRKYFRKKASNKGKLDTFLEKYNLPRAYFNINRRMITKGVWVGLFWAFIPMPMQMLGVIIMTPFFRFNVPIAIVMVWLSNPFTMPIMYYVEYLTGNFILGREGIADLELTIEWFSNHMGDIFLPLYVGTAFYSIVVSTLIYIAINWLWIRSVKEEKFEKEKKSDKKSK